MGAERESPRAGHMATLDREMAAYLDSAAGQMDWFMAEVGQQQSERRVSGIAISDGLAFARAEVLQISPEGEVVARDIRPEEADRELNRLQHAIMLVADDLNNLAERVSARVGPSAAAIFQAQRAIVQDPALLLEAERLIREQLLNAEAATWQVLREYELRMLAIDNTALRERAADLVDVRRRLLAMLRQMERAPEPVPEVPSPSATATHAQVDGHPVIVVAEELLPGDTVAFEANRVVGILTEHGGPASHAAILARALGIPAVTGIPGLLDKIRPGEPVLVNGRTGEVIIRPERETLALYPGLSRFDPLKVQVVEPIPEFAVYANINSIADMPLTHLAKADGIGLYRTEFEFIIRDRLLNEEEQYDLYVRIVEAMNGKPVCIRVLDLGGDKAARFLNLPQEENPVLGYRGARLLLGHPHLLETQARAIARASMAGPVQVLYPMVADPLQFYTLRELFRQATADIHAGPMQHGPMFEVPSACISARDLLAMADFASIGTNDLIQYLFAVDRNNELVAGDYNPSHPALWTILTQLYALASEMNKPLSICGELASNRQMIPRLIEIGARSVSVSPRLIGQARLAARAALRASAKPGTRAASGVSS